MTLVGVSPSPTVSESVVSTVVPTVSESVDALMSDGRIVHLQTIGPPDRDQLLALHERASDQSIYWRFFNPNREAARSYVRHLAEASDGHRTVGAFRRGQLIGVGSYEPAAGQSAEFALLVDDDYQHTGIGTLLLEHTVAIARAAGVRRFTADVLAANNAMVEVIRDLGFPASTHLESGELHVEFPLDVSERVIAAISEREERAGSASLQPLLRPRSVAVVGAGERPGSVGHEVLRNILDAGFAGPVYAVNPRHQQVLGVACVPDPGQLPEAVDLAVIAVPATATLPTVRACAERGCRAAVLLGSGFGEVGEAGSRLQDQILTVAREHDMRLVGPNCVGVANTAARLDATFARLPRRPGRLALMTQSGAVGAAIATAADLTGLGLAELVSVGNKSDVGGNDLLLAWEDDPDVGAIALYLESVGDPRRLARIARRVSARKPVLALKSGRTAATRRAGRSHTAAAALPDVAVDALFDRAGIVRVETLSELIESARVLLGQPLPPGPRVAIIGNSGGPEILAADALPRAGLTLADFTAATGAALSELGVPAQNPIDLGAEARAQQLEQALPVLLAAAEIDAVVTVFTAVAVTDIAAIRAAVAGAADSAPKPIVSVVVGEPPDTVTLRSAERSLAVFTFPEPAVAALGVAHRYAAIAARGPAAPPARPAGIDTRAAERLVDAARAAGRTWLDPDECSQLLAAYGLPVIPQRTVADEAAALAGAAELGYPVAVKVATPGIHKSAVGGVRLGVRDAAELATTVRELGVGATPLLMQPMAAAGAELIVGAVRDSQCGALVMVGAGGVDTERADDRTFALAPLTGGEAPAMLLRLRMVAGLSDAAQAAAADVLARVGTLVDDLDEVAELDLNPVICGPSGALLVDARIRIEPPVRTPDPLVRQLREPRQDARP